MTQPSKACDAARATTLYRVTQLAAALEACRTAPAQLDVNDVVKLRWRLRTINEIVASALRNLQLGDDADVEAPSEPQYVIRVIMAGREDGWVTKLDADGLTWAYTEGSVPFMRFTRAEADQFVVKHAYSLATLVPELAPAAARATGGGMLIKKALEPELAVEPELYVIRVSQSGRQPGWLTKIEPNALTWRQSEHPSPFLRFTKEEAGLVVIRHAFSMATLTIEPAPAPAGGVITQAADTTADGKAFTVEAARTEAPQPVAKDWTAVETVERVVPALGPVVADVAANTKAPEPTASDMYVITFDGVEGDYFTTLPHTDPMAPWDEVMLDRLFHLAAVQLRVTTPDLCPRAVNGTLHSIGTIDGAQVRTPVHTYAVVPPVQHMPPQEYRDLMRAAVSCLPAAFQVFVRQHTNEGAGIPARIQAMQDMAADLRECLKACLTGDTTDSLFHVAGSHGVLTALTYNGQVVHYDNYGNPDEYADIERFDVAEYRRAYGKIEDTDILLIGYTTTAGKYEPA